MTMETPIWFQRPLMRSNDIHRSSFLSGLRHDATVLSWRQRHDERSMETIRNHTGWSSFSMSLISVAIYLDRWSWDPMMLSDDMCTETPFNIHWRIKWDWHTVDSCEILHQLTAALSGAFQLVMGDLQKWMVFIRMGNPSQNLGWFDDWGYPRDDDFRTPPYKYPKPFIAINNGHIYTLIWLIVGNIYIVWYDLISYLIWDTFIIHWYLYYDRKHHLIVSRLSTKSSKGGANYSQADRQHSLARVNKNHQTISLYY